MGKYIAIVAAILATVGTIQAAERKAPRVVACQDFDTLKGSNGVALGVCAPKKPGGKATYLGSFQVVSIVNPATGAAERVLVGFVQ